MSWLVEYNLRQKKEENNGLLSSIRIPPHQTKILLGIFRCKNMHIPQVDVTHSKETRNPIDF